MPEKTKDKDFIKGVKKDSDEKCGDEEQSSWSDDQKNRGYYYDDASGYEIYIPEDEDEEDKPAG